MIEVVFSDSACGGLKMAQTFGKGEDCVGHLAVLVAALDGAAPTGEEIAEAQREAEERNRLEWEKAAPMGGKPEDVFGFNLILSVGDISNGDFFNHRQKAIEALWSIYPEESSGKPIDVTTELQEALTRIRARLSKGEDIRIWYSNQPDELCGLFWFTAELTQMGAQIGEVYIVKLPEYEYCDDNTVVSHISWGELSPGEWHRYIPLAEKTTAVFRSSYLAPRWRNLQKENAPLRAVLNGQLLSVSETIYDDYIWQEIEAQGDEFQEAVVVGRVLGKYQLGIGDAWIAQRIEKMVYDGKLSIVSGPVKGCPTYHRKLRKG